MKKIVFVLIAVTALFLVINAQGTSETKTTGVNYTTTQGLKALMDSEKEFLLVDVRTLEEYNTGHIPGAVNIPYETIVESIPVQDKDALLVVYCRSGNRSGIAYQSLKDAGYTNIHDFGGISNWTEELVIP